MTIKNALKSISEVFVYLFGVVGVIYLISNIRRVLSVVYAVLTDRDELFSISGRDMGFRAWYNKISDDFNYYGRARFSWDDGLGLSLASRAYNNLITYSLSYYFGQLKLVVFGYLICLLVLFLIGYLVYPFFNVLILCVLLLCSPLFVQVFLNLGKPETFWYFSIPLISYIGFSEYAYISSLLWTVLAFANAPLAFLVAVTIMPAILLFQLIQGYFDLAEFFVFILMGLPGGIKLLLRLVFMYQSGYLAIIGNEQSGLWKRGFLELRHEWLTYIVFSLSLVASTKAMELSLLSGLSIASLFIIINYINWRLIYLNDTQGFMMLFFLFSITLGLLSGSYLGMFFSFLLSLRPIYFRFDMISLPKSFSIGDIYSSWKKTFQEVFQLNGMTLKSDVLSDPLSILVNSIPKHSRVLILMPTSLRQSPYRMWVETCREVLYKRRIMHLNDCYGAMQSSDLITVINEIHSVGILPEHIDLFQFLSIDYVITLDREYESIIRETSEFKFICRESGFSKVHKELVDTCLFQTSFRNLFYDFSISGNSISFRASVDGLSMMPIAYSNELNVSVDGVPGELSSGRYKGISDVHFCETVLQKGQEVLMTSKNRLFPNFKVKK